MSPSKKRVLAPEILNRAVEEVAIFAEQNHMRVALVGGYALQLYGSDRLTGDIDVITDEIAPDTPQIKLLSFGGVQIETHDGVPVDLIVRSDDFQPLYDEALDKTVRIENVAMPVVQPEYIAAMKMVADRTRDELDLEWLILSGTIDIDKTKQVIRQFLGLYAAKSFDQFVEVTRWKASVGRI
jgi:hypothetical protein